MGFSSIAQLALDEIREKSKLRLYQRDFLAWRHDVVGFYSYEKMNGIMETALFGEKPRTLIKSSNGTSKSHEVTLGILWAGSVFEPGEAVNIVSAPSVSQLEKVCWAYLKSHYGRAATRGFKLPGHINESLEWKYEGPSGGIYLAFGRKPPTGDSAVSVFQGVRSQFGRTYVWFDEAGGMEKAMWTAVEAIITGADARFIGIGNPDHGAGSEFHRAFTDEKVAQEYNLFTLSSFDLPTFTGERVYPMTPEGDAMEARMLKSLTQVEWVEHKKRVWGEKDPRYLSKVLGEFPGDGDSNFFPQQIITLSQDTDIPEDPDVRPVLGVDVARYGQDETVVYSNVGGRVRLVGAWGKTDLVESARKINQIALELGASEVRIDSAGIGGGVFDILEKSEEYWGKTYALIGIDGGSRSPDLTRWANARAYNHDYLRTEMSEGRIDIDFDDRELAEQLIGVTFKFNNRGAIQISPKDEMRTVMGGSPDRLDALIYSVVDLDWALGGIPPGTVVAKDWDGVEVDGFAEYMRRPGQPLLL